MLPKLELNTHPWSVTASPCLASQSTPPFPPLRVDGDILRSLMFQEEDLNCIRERWSEALIKRREYLDEQIKKIIHKQGEAGCSLLFHIWVIFFLVFYPRQLFELLLALVYPEKSEEDVEREARLVEQWVGLTEERNAVLVPAPGSGIPGAPADW